MFFKKNKKIVLGSIVNFDFQGLLNGVPFPGGSDTNYDLKIGSGEFIAGFEEKMIGLKEKEKKDISLTFPNDYFDENLAGKDVIFKIKINRIK